MKAIGFQQALPISDPNALVNIEVPQPIAYGRDLLVRVEAVSVNPVDTKIRTRSSAANDEFIVLGWDAVGTVEAVGEGVRLFSPGERVWYAGAIDRPGTNAEYHLVNECIVGKAPVSISSEQAAALPLTSITAWEMLFDRFALNSESSGILLIIGGAGGVGSVMIQLARRLTNLTIVATASRPETQNWVLQMGAHYVVNHGNSLVTEFSGIGLNCANYVASLTNTDEHFPEIIELIAPQGKLGVIDDPATLDVIPLKRKSISLHWEFMFTRSLFATSDMIEQNRLLSNVAFMVDSGEIQSTLVNHYGTINAANLMRAHATLESGKSWGKIVLSGFD